MRRYIAELIGTFALVFAGTGAIIINDVSGGVITHVGIALTFGLVVMAEAIFLILKKDCYLQAICSAVFCISPQKQKAYPEEWY